MSTLGDVRADRLAAAVAADGLDQLLVGDLVRPGDASRSGGASLTWLTGFAGTSGIALIGAQERTFATDFRYAEVAAETIPETFERQVVDRQLLPEVAERLSGRVGFDESNTSVHVHARLGELAGEGVELVPSADLLTRMRRHKDAAERVAIAEAARLTDAVYESIEERGVVGRTERDVALAAEMTMRELGAEGPAFPPIVAAGPNAALPHAEPSEREISDGDLVIIDLGAILDRYSSDCTRTVAAGARPAGDQMEAYQVVLDAQLAALAATEAGAGGKAVDAAARDVIAAAGRGAQFGHGLGHGVGIETHEAPRLSQRSEDELAEGDVVTIEPGVYVAGEFGVRIEDLVIVTETGHENLSGHPKELTVVA